ncbi:MAG: zinc ribbon domain-containing protein [Lachnospiraceae bacterium]
MELFSIILVFVPFVFLMVLLITGYVIYNKFMRSVRGLSREFLGTTNIREGLRKAELEVQETPKSISGMESTARTQILRDFPDLSIENLKSRNIEKLYAVFHAIEMKCVDDLEEKTIIHQVKSIVEDHLANATAIDQVKIHKQVINRYLPGKENCVIRFQIAFEYVLKTTTDSIGVKKQARAETEWIYSMDETNFNGNTTVTLNCPNCKAPITNLGDKYCEYCGSEIKVDYKKAWQFNSIKLF